MKTVSATTRRRRTLAFAYPLLLLGLVPSLTAPVAAANLPAPATALRSARFT